MNLEPVSPRRFFSHLPDFITRSQTIRDNFIENSVRARRFFLFRSRTFGRHVRVACDGLSHKRILRAQQSRF